MKITVPRNFQEWFAFCGGEEAVSRGVTREDFEQCFIAGINASWLARTQKSNGESLNVKDIVIRHLKENGFDGIYNPGECSCTPDNMFPCGNDFSECEPGYKNKCTCGEGCDFHIGQKPEERAVLNHTTNGFMAAGSSEPSAQIGEAPTS